MQQAVGDGTPHPSQYDIPPTAQPVTIVPPAKNPAIQRNADLLPEIPDDARLPAHVVEFPNPMAIKDSTGEVKGQVDRLYDHQREGAERILAAWQKRDGIILGDSAGLGKCQPIHTRVATPEGWRAIGELCVGDRVLGSDGQAAAVTGVFPQGVRESYRMIFSDGSAVESGAEHLWTVLHHCGGKRWETLTLTTEQIRTRPKLTRRWEDGRETELDLSKTKLRIPMLAAPATFEEQPELLPVPPYTLGQLIGNGACSGPTPALATNALDWSEVQTRINAELQQYPSMTLGMPGNYGQVVRATLRGATDAMRGLALDVLSGAKFIPRRYLMADPAARIALLQGLMDTDGSVSKTRNRVTFHTTSACLAGNVQELVESLGGIASERVYDRTHEDKGTEYQVRMRLPAHVQPFSVNRKACRYQPGRMGLPVRVIVACEEAGEAEQVCIRVDAEDELYCTEHYIVTHNTNTALAAIVANGGKRNLIVVPTRGKEGLKEQWAGPACAGLYNLKMRGVDDLHATEDGTYIVSYDELMVAQKDAATGKRTTSLRPELFAGQWDTVTFDESHTMCNAKSKAAEAGKALQERAEKVAYLSATPFTDLSDMHYLTKLGMFGDGAEEFAKWATIAGGDVTPNGKVRNPRSWLPMAAIAAVMHVDGLSVRRLTSLEGMGSEFSELQMPQEARETFSLAEQVCEIASQMGTDGNISRMLYTSWARQYWETLKVDEAIKVGKKAREEGKQVAYFCSYKTAEHKHMAAIPAMMRKAADKIGSSDAPGADQRAMELNDAAARCEELIGRMAKPVNPIEALREAFGGAGAVAEIHGNTTKKPGAEQRAYQSGKKKVVVATMARGGTGISLHDTSGTAPRVQVNLSLPWSGREFDQVAGRSHRLGSKSETKMHWLLGAHDNERHNAAVVARRLKSMGSLTSGDPALNPDAHALARWEIAKNRPDDDDIEAEVKTMMEQASAMQELADADGDESKTAGRPVDAEAEETRDYFETKLREFAEARKAGRDILRELYDTATVARAKRTHLEERRAAAQLEAVHGWRVEYTEGGKAVLHTRYNEAHIAKINNQGGRWDAYRKVWTIDAARLPRLAKTMGVHEHKVDMHEVARKTAEKTKAGEAGGPAAAAPDHATIAATLRDKFGLHLVPVPGWSGGVGVVGNTFQHQHTIKPHASGFRHLGDGIGKGWVVHQSKLAALHAALTGGGGMKKSLLLRFVVRRGLRPGSAWA